MQQKDWNALAFIIQSDCDICETDFLSHESPTVSWSCSRLYYLRGRMGRARLSRGRPDVAPRDSVKHAIGIGWPGYALGR
jgi:hypothetical protein